MRLREGGTEERLALVKWGWNSITERQKSMALYQPQAAGGAHHRLSESGGVRNLSTTFLPGKPKVRIKACCCYCVVSIIVGVELMVSFPPWTPVVGFLALHHV